MSGQNVIDAKQMSDDVLVGFDRMMIKAIIQIDDVSSLAMAIWSDALKELDERGKVKLISGSYDDIGKSLVARHY